MYIMCKKISVLFNMSQAEVSLLKQFSGEGIDSACLKEIAFTSGQCILYIHVHMLFP